MHELFEFTLRHQPRIYSTCSLTTSKINYMCLGEKVDTFLYQPHIYSTCSFNTSKINQICLGEKVDTLFKNLSAMLWIYFCRSSGVFANFFQLGSFLKSKCDQELREVQEILIESLHLHQENMSV